MAVLINKQSEIETVRNMPNSEIETYICAAYKRENNRRILRERIIEGKTYREIIEKHYFCPVGDWQEEQAERIIRARINEIQRMETKFYRVVRTSWRKTDLKPCPFCGREDAVTISVCDDEGNYHGEIGCDYEQDPWSGLSYALAHEGWGRCILCTDNEPMGGILFDTAEDAAEAWNRRVNDV